MENKYLDIEILRSALSGQSLTKILKLKKCKKYELHKQTGISYMTLHNWEKGRFKPSKEFAIRVGRYLGLIKPEQTEIFILKDQLKELQLKLDRIEKS